MSEFPPPGATNEAKSPAFADALQRARQIASKIKPTTDAPPPVGIKRPLYDAAGEGPENKKLVSDPFGGRSSDMQAPDMMGGGGASETIMVPDEMVGLIIGRGGEQITRLQAESGCKIQMAPDSAGMAERQCTLSGAPQAIQQARSAIERIIASEGSGGPPPRGPGMGMGGGGGGPPGGGGGFYEQMIAGHKVGLIIGKGGETIKQLQEQSGAKIVIIQDSPEAAQEKPLRITGTPDAVEHAKQLVFEIIGAPGQDNGDMGGFGGRGRGRGRGRGGFPGRGRGRGGFGGQWGGPGGEYGAQHTEFVPVPANKCGLIIGKGGETIKQINAQTGAQCEIDKNAPPEAREKNFIIRGDPTAVEKAKQMIMEKIGMQPSNGSYGGSYGGGGGSWGGQQYQQQGYDASQGHSSPDSNAPSGVAVNPQTGQPDYSQQWAEYYRSMGMHKEAEAIEQHARAKSAAAAPVQPSPVQNGSAAGQADYSAQWAEYYRSIGKIKEAEAIEAQMKQKAGQPAGGGGYPGAPAAASQYPGYYGGQAPQPGAPAGGYQGYNQYPGYGGQPE